MCHNFAGAGGALTQGKYAPSLEGSSGKHIYEAMLTGPQSMPVFNDANISPEQKRDVIAYLKTVQREPSEGGAQARARSGDRGPVRLDRRHRRPHRLRRLARVEGRLT
ncbi:hypothetical protein GCM10025868_43310 [Angustibacter aerolatus]|uniref:Cytochrome c domain-containing protein n=1 Tax=Angustibacter aerolatus TaxID=1162965 RepID=A0ABQ6JLE9_9ACTN|nr:cytochrome c [Angustibacter aerolatus]GMA89081.1 hypothetical protein GCM10025868_43310 [Angustibacter aerolatus]